MTEVISADTEGAQWSPKTGWTKAPVARPFIPPRNVMPPHGKPFGREWFIRLPEGMGLDDLKDPDVFRAIQGNSASSLTELDEVTLVSFDRKWLVKAIVGRADHKGVQLFAFQKFDMPERYDRLPEDEMFGSRWNGVGYEIFRKSDGKPIPTPFLANVNVVQQEMTKLHPKKMGGR